MAPRAALGVRGRPGFAEPLEYPTTSGIDGCRDRRDDAAIEQLDMTAGMAGVARIVGDHADGCSNPVHFPQQFHYRLTALESRLPVGSSSPRQPVAAAPRKG